MSSKTLYFAVFGFLFFAIFIISDDASKEAAIAEQEAALDAERKAIHYIDLRKGRDNALELRTYTGAFCYGAASASDVGGFKAELRYPGHRDERIFLWATRGGVTIYWAFDPESREALTYRHRECNHPPHGEGYISPRR